MTIEQDGLRAELRALMDSFPIELPAYSADPIVQRRVGQLLATYARPRPVLSPSDTRVAQERFPLPDVGLHPNIMEQYVRIKMLFTSALFATALISASAHAQGTLRGAEEGAHDGGRAAGPVGAVVGGAVGAVTGTIGGILGVDDRPRFREYVVRERRPSYQYREELRVGAVLPQTGVTYYDVPAEYHAAPGYRYTYVNDRPVIVESRTGRIVEILD